MSKKSKTLLAALGILALLSAAYYGSTVWAKKKAGSASSPYSPSTRLGNLESSELVKIEVPGLTLEKEGSTWELKLLNGAIPPSGIELDQGQITSLCYSLASIWIDSIVDENPEDLSVYGLENPYSRAIITDLNGTKAEYILGDMTPSRSTYYLMEEGDPKVYSVSAYLAENINLSLDKIRQKSLFPAFQLNELTRFSMESEGNSIEIATKPENTPPYLASIYTSHILTSPYKLPRGVSAESLRTLLTPFNNLKVADFIDDNPLSLRTYGLDKPVKILLQTRDKTLDLLIGNEVDEKCYAKLAGTPGVFTLSGMESIIKTKPFDLADKFVLLVNIDSVSHIEIRGGQKNLSADLQHPSNPDEEETFFLNGEKTQTSTFKSFYESIISLMADAEYPKAPVTAPAQTTDGDGNITIEYQLNSPQGERLSITLIPYNRDFYALRQEGVTEFLVSRNQVSRIFDTADKIIYE